MIMIGMTAVTGGWHQLLVCYSMLGLCVQFCSALYARLCLVCCGFVFYSSFSSSQCMSPPHLSLPVQSYGGYAMQPLNSRFVLEAFNLPRLICLLVAFRIGSTQPSMFNFRLFCSHNPAYSTYTALYDIYIYIYIYI